MGANEIQEKKIAGKTAIPTGSYEITLNVQSPKFSDFTKYPAYKFCDGYLPRLKDVPGFDGILIHIGNYDTDTDGCILIGYNTAKGMVSQSTDTFKRLYDLLVSSDGEIYIEIV